MVIGAMEGKVVIEEAEGMEEEGVVEAGMGVEGEKVDHLEEELDGDSSQVGVLNTGCSKLFRDDASLPRPILGIYNQC